jgi:SAM-dependent methyltransferase
MDQAYAAQYRRLYERHWWWRARERAILDTLRRSGLANQGRPILDIGCGDGLLMDRLVEFGEPEGIGIEIDESLVSSDGRWRKQIHIGPFDGEFQPSRRYALIVMLDVLEHLPDAPAALRHAIELLADDGLLLITVPAFRALWTSHDELNHHYTRYTKRTFSRLATEAGLAIDEMRYLFHWTCPVKLAVRLKESLLHSVPAPPKIPSPLINSALYGLTCFEQAVLGRVPMPFGSSLLVVGHRQHREARRAT